LRQLCEAAVLCHKDPCMCFSRHACCTNVTHTLLPLMLNLLLLLASSATKALNLAYACREMQDRLNTLEAGTQELQAQLDTAHQQVQAAQQQR